jgi:hypothetical protein
MGDDGDEELPKGRCSGCCAICCLLCPRSCTRWWRHQLEDEDEEEPALPATPPLTSKPYQIPNPTEIATAWGYPLPVYAPPPIVYVAYQVDASTSAPSAKSGSE